MRVILTTILLTAVVLTAACAPTFDVTVGLMPAHDPGSKIEPGVTTKTEVMGLFGQPDFTGVDKDGLLQWTWTHLGVKATPGKEATITSFFNLEVSFDGELVKSYSYSKKRTD
jgi:hypothetical protein